mmetsp:Transcript_87897/g.238336  ORF Transcript_87897/g.238336 Transcript_87897/m.238336 type:complete len:378 (+) Transcript_87897:93-1226(+)
MAPAAPPPAEKSLWRAGPYILVWMAVSISLIFMNRGIVKTMGCPAFLTAWHMAVSSVLVRALRCVAPPRLGLFSEERLEVSLQTWLTKLLPIAALFSTSLAMGNRAYLYSSVAFIQMMKASHAVMTYLLNALVGAELFTWNKLRIVILVCCGVVLAVTGELHFRMVGFLCQSLSSVSECARIVLIGQLLNKSGLKMDPLTAISYYAPLCLVFLVPLALVTEMPSDWGAFAEDLQREVGFCWLLLNGLVAFTLNVFVVLLIDATSPVVFVLCGIMKDVALVVGSVVVLHQAVALQQIVGYAAAVVGIQLFNLVSRNQDELEAKGLVRGSWDVVSRWLAPEQAKADEMGELSNHKDVLSESLASGSTRAGSPLAGEPLE